ncbi:hypothetical protein LCGC14_1830590 [marine sediment metagenome]|uniref:Uncharacterized protein n=1 Tax=marine sediment metagenome TaxID=412755 RepID=A0A0F9GGH7_9ZZZZ
MAINEPIWSYGESKLFNSSSSTTDPDDAWDYGENRLLHEYIGGWAHKWNGIAGASITAINGVPTANIAKVNGI